MACARRKRREANEERLMHVGIGLSRRSKQRGRRSRTIMLFHGR